MGDATKKPKTIGLGYRIIAFCIYLFLALFLVFNFMFILVGIVDHHHFTLNLLFFREVCAVIALLNLMLYLFSRQQLRLNPKNKQAISAMTVIAYLTIMMTLNGHYVLFRYLSRFKKMSDDVALLTMGLIVGGTLIGYTIVSGVFRKYYRSKTGPTQ
jgi:hypothetical protein